MKLLFILFILLLILLYLLNKKEKFMKSSNKSFQIEKYRDAEKLGKLYINKFPFATIPEHCAVMFDIDDTLLYIPNKYEKNVTNNLTIIKPIKNLLDFCIKKGLLVIIITARDISYKTATIQELDHHSINYSSLYLHQPYEGETLDDFTMFKSNIKKYILEKYNIKIIMSVGDQNIDVIGKYSGYGLKLPNKTDSRLYEVYPNSSQLTIFS